MFLQIESNIPLLVFSLQIIGLSVLDIGIYSPVIKREGSFEDKNTPPKLPQVKRSVNAVFQRDYESTLLKSTNTDLPANPSEIIGYFVLFDKISELPAMAALK